jgi:D-glycero-D-manno-heptose 1,7-bisphosphate phosphatase
VNRAIFLDRDGTVIEELGYLNDPARVTLLPGAADALLALQSGGWKLFIVSNQSGVGRGLITPPQMDAVHRRFLELLKKHGIEITESYMCEHAPEEGCQCRKPSPFFLRRAAQEHGIDLGSSWMIGDRDSDILCGVNAGCSTIWRRNEMFPITYGLATVVANNWDEIGSRLASE